jgi:hypothetical protein
MELGGAGHMDGLLGLLLAASLLAIHARRLVLGALLLAAAALVKNEALVVLPLVVAALAGPNRGVPTRRWAALFPAIVIAILLAAYVPLGGPMAGLTALKASALMVIRSLPQAVAYASGLPGPAVAVVCRAVFLILLAFLTYRAWHGRPVLELAVLTYGAYLFLGKALLMPWHVCVMPFLVGAVWLTGRRPRETAVCVWGASALLGESYIFLADSTAPDAQSVSAVIMLVPPLLAATLGPWQIAVPSDARE